MANVWVAMSGGVDSSVAAARLVAQGHQVTGITMRLLPGKDHADPPLVDIAHAACRVCDQLDIPHHTLDLRTEFAECVMRPFAAAYAAGHTPNPCVLCNERLKFTALLEHVLAQGADMLATGHYARIVRDLDGSHWLQRAVDKAKDQSYFLYRLTDGALDRVVFPLGDSTKDDVRKEAVALKLATASRPESQEVCFVPADAGSFVVASHPEAGERGPIVSEAGEAVGIHRGIAHYTLGQRKGLGLSGGPWYVCDIQPHTRTIVVARREPSLVTHVNLEDVVWRMGSRAEVDAVVRYRASAVRAIAQHAHAGVSLTFSAPVPRVAPGQSVVCYMGDRVVGGGVVSAKQ